MARPSPETSYSTVSVAPGVDGLVVDGVLGSVGSGKTGIGVRDVVVGAGMVEVGSGSDLWSTFVDLETGRKYKPIAWDVAGEGFVVKETRSEPKKHSVVCAYDDGVATGTVTVKKA